ncbi:MAG: aminoacyl-tRNA hydrolase [Proteobacteria bacterium]|nr:aminoacyl-tRNA hydrolase [Pseudomonadota bacterium]
MKLIVGLGNPGGKYFKTRHNAGFLVLDQILFKAGGHWQGSKFDSEYARAPVCGIDSVLIKPQTFMNLSGRSVVKALQFFKISSADLVVLHDDIDVPFGKVKARQGGGHGGHNGIRSILTETGAENFGRIKLGVGRPQSDRIDVADWVLAEFANDELLQIEGPMVDEAMLRIKGLFQNPDKN